MQTSHLKQKFFYILLLLFMCFLSISCSQTVQTTQTVLNETTNHTTDSHPITIYIASDLHYLSKELHDDGEAFQLFSDTGNGQEVTYIDTIVDGLMQEVKAASPDYLILSGDLTVNGEEQSHKDIADKLSELTNTKVMVIPGNHDINNIFARAFEGENQLDTPYISDSQFREIYYNYGYREALSQDKNSLSYMSRLTNDLWVLMLDTSLYQNNIAMNNSVMGGAVSEQTIEWIKGCSEQAKKQGAQLITVTHHNLMDHNERIYFNYTLYSNQEILNLYQQLSIPLNFSGHIHTQNIAVEQGIYDVATGALCVYPHNYGILTYQDKQLEYKVTPIDIEGYAKQRGLSDSSLLHYEDYVNQNNQTSRIADSLEGDYTKEELVLAKEFLLELNKRYFSGRSYDDLLTTKGYELVSQETGFIKDYLNSIIKSGDVPNDTLKLDLKTDKSE